MEPNTVILNTFRIKKYLASGGMADVFTAEHLKTGADVVVKVLKEHYDKSSAIHQRFLREVQNSKVLSHDSIVKVYGGGEFRGETFMIMELMDAGSLADIIDEHKTIPWPLATYIMARVFAGLEYSHKQKIIHRDMKPDNLLINTKGEVKITDFGISKALERTVMTQEGEILGTPAYMAPEQITGAPVSAQTDMFSCGVIYLELLTGENPFMGNGINETISRILAYEEPPLDTLDPLLPDSIRVALNRMLSKAPHERFQTIGEARERMEYILQRNGFKVGKKQLKAFLRDPATVTIDLQRQVGAALFKQIAEEGQNANLRNVKDAFEFAVKILDVFRHDPCHGQAMQYLRDFLKGWNAELPRNVTADILRLEEQCKESGLEQEKFEDLLRMHEESKNYLDVVYYLGALGMTNPADDTIYDRIDASLEQLRAHLEYRLLGTSAGPAPRSMGGRAEPSAKLKVPMDQTQAIPAPPGRPSSGAGQASGVNRMTQSRTPANPTVSGRATPRPRPATQVSPSIRRAVPTNRAEEQRRGFPFILTALVVIQALYIGYGYYLDRDPLHELVEVMNPELQMEEYSREEIESMPDGGLLYYQGVISDNVRAREVHYAYKKVLELLQKRGDTEAYLRYDEEYKAIFGQ